MSHKGVVLKEIHCEGVKDYGPEAALVLNFKHYYCTYKHRFCQTLPAATVESQFRGLQSLNHKCLIFFLQFPLIFLITVLSRYCQDGKKPTIKQLSCIAAKTQIFSVDLFCIVKNEKTASLSLAQSLSIGTDIMH